MDYGTIFLASYSGIAPIFLIFLSYNETKQRHCTSIASPILWIGLVLDLYWTCIGDATEQTGFKWLFNHSR